MLKYILQAQFRLSAWYYIAAVVIGVIAGVIAHRGNSNRENFKREDFNRANTKSAGANRVHLTRGNSNKTIKKGITAHTKINRQSICIALIAFYLALVFSSTVLTRHVTGHYYELMPFWSYVKIAQGNRWLLYEDILNVFLLMPVGILLEIGFDKVEYAEEKHTGQSNIGQNHIGRSHTSQNHTGQSHIGQSHTGRKSHIGRSYISQSHISVKYAGIKHAALTGLVISASIELTQLITHRGLFEFDDILHNTVGCVIGYVVCRWIRKMIGRIRTIRKSGQSA